jgi:hypothetical protein
LFQIKVPNINTLQTPFLFQTKVTNTLSKPLSCCKLKVPIDMKEKEEGQGEREEEKI